MSQTPLRILLVDDEQDIVYVLAKGLELNGFRVDGFTDPKEALKQFRPNHYDAMITDIRMPGMGGLELYAAIREKDATLRVYFVSAFESYAAEIAKRFSSDELVRFIKKPTTYNLLAEALQKDLGKMHVTV